MAKINGIPMIGHVYLRSKMCSTIDEVYVATCNEEIIDYIESIGGKALMTSDKHERASDRTAEAMLIIEEETGEKIDIIAMIQGDEPMLLPKMLEEAIDALICDEDLMITNLMASIKDRAEHSDPNDVKVVVDKDNYAMYFSREPIPSWKKGNANNHMLKQLGIIFFRRNALVTFNGTEQTPLEIIESVDMLRMLENGISVKMIHSDENIYSVDTEDDLKKVEVAMQGDTLLANYK
ncbi:MAG: 3-deoxy-manno-octulosonate cytidylyltransferase [Oscillospiraceae bacterium]|nr:3-deoxy-manno-octulosonate cytidylyltransferase [Oscillospiraceae bacterium]